jgi:hypothetical protein
MHYWVNRHNHLQESIDANEFTPIAAEAFAKLKDFETQEEKTTTVKAPAEFKTSSKWKMLEECCFAYFNSM